MSPAEASVAISVFSRAPVPGNTKRRLIPALGPQGAADLHKRMLRQVLGVATEIETASVTLVCTPDTTHPFFVSQQAKLDIGVVSQQGEDLGARMSFELNRCLKTHAAAVVVGSDCPFIEPGDFYAAIDALLGGARVAVGPSLDGGYYLMGLSEPSPALFSNMMWGTGSVFDTTVERINSLGYQWVKLTQRADIDRPQDLGLLPCP